MKSFREMSPKEWSEAVEKLASDLSNTDLNVFRESTLRRMYADMYGVDDDIERAYSIEDIKNCLYDEDITDEQADKISIWLETKGDSTLTFWENITNAYDTLKEEF